MKKLVLLLSLLLYSCSFRNDYYTLNVDGYKFTVGYDNAEYLKTTFNLNIKDEIDVGETINDINVYAFDDYFCRVDICNNTGKVIESGKGVISKLILYCNDVGERTYAIDDVQLETSISSNCDKFNGTLIKRNGYACVIESTKSGKLNVVELHGDILAKDQDKLDHLIIYVK